MNVILQRRGYLYAAVGIGQIYSVRPCGFAAGKLRRSREGEHGIRTRRANKDCAAALLAAVCGGVACKSAAANVGLGAVSCCRIDCAALTGRVVFKGAVLNGQCALIVIDKAAVTPICCSIGFISRLVAFEGSAVDGHGGTFIHIDCAALFGGALAVLYCGVFNRQRAAVFHADCAAAGGRGLAVLDGAVFDNQRAAIDLNHPIGSAEIIAVYRYAVQCQACTRRDGNIAVSVGTPDGSTARDGDSVGDGGSPCYGQSCIAADESNLTRNRSSRRRRIILAHGLHGGGENGVHIQLHTLGGAAGNGKGVSLGAAGGRQAVFGEGDVFIEPPPQFGRKGPLVLRADDNRGDIAVLPCSACHLVGVLVHLLHPLGAQAPGEKQGEHSRFLGVPTLVYYILRIVLLILLLLRPGGLPLSKGTGGHKTQHHCQTQKHTQQAFFHCAPSISVFPGLGPREPPHRAREIPRKALGTARLIYHSIHSYFSTFSTKNQGSCREMSSRPGPNRIPYLQGVLILAYLL